MRPQDIEKEEEGFFEKHNSKGIILVTKFDKGLSANFPAKEMTGIKEPEKINKDIQSVTITKKKKKKSNKPSLF